VSTINLGPVSRIQVIDELKDSVSNILDRLDKDELTKQQLKQHNEKLRACIIYLIKPMHTEDGTAIAPSILSKEELVEFDGIRLIASVTKEWAGSIYLDDCEVIQEIAEVHRDFCALKSEWDELSEDCNNYDEYYYHMHPRALAMSKLSKEVLVEESIFPKDKLHMPDTWLEMLKLRKEIFDKVKIDAEATKAQLVEAMYGFNDLL